jgi:hypothetical protein
MAFAYFYEACFNVSANVVTPHRSANGPDSCELRKKSPRDGCAGIEPLFYNVVALEPTVPGRSSASSCLLQAGAAVLPRRRARSPPLRLARPRSRAAPSTMGRRRAREVNPKTERLPKAERAESGSKLTLRKAYSLSLSTSSASLSPMATLTISPHPIPLPALPSSTLLSPASLLPDDLLRRILRLAGLRATLAALQVSWRWRAAAHPLLARTRRIDAAALLKAPPADLTYPGALRALRAFPAATALSLRGWPATPAVLADIAPAVMTHFASPTLREIDLSGLAFAASDLHALLSHCPALSVVRLVGCECVNDVVLARMVASRRDGAAPARFDMVDVSHCRDVTRVGLLQLLHAAEVVAAAGVHSLGVLVARAVRAREFNLPAARGLYAAFLTLRPGALLALNLSQCTSLTRVTLLRAPADAVGVPDATPLALETLSLHGASQLHDVDFGPPVEAPSGEAGDVESRLLPNLRSISLFGARALGPEFFRTRLALGSLECTTPRLEQLNLNGCLGLDRLVLTGYPVLRVVDCSGCLILDYLRVADVLELESLSVRGRRAPLRHVDVSIPATAEVQGVRRGWRVERSSSHVHISFP